jgi:hypothetical protein
MVSLLSLAFLTAAINAPVTVPLAPSSPRLDCALDDEAWARAALLGGFRQTHPEENAGPSHKTLVRLVYTTDALHVAIEAFDDPGLVRSTLANRDGIGAEDHVTLYLDTFQDRRRAYVLMVNALGVQQDGLLVEGREPDFSVDIDFRSSGCVTKEGYTIEISLPFQSIRYNAGVGRSWGLHVLRQVQRLGEENSWMPLRRDRTSVDGTSGRQLRSRFLSQAGAIDGLDRAAHVPIIDVIPVLGGTRTQDGTTRATLGGTARIGLSPATALDIAVNPDFAEVEADEPQSTANQRFPLFYEEKRPFFLEGKDLLTTPIRAFHSRTIVDPDGALKLTTTRGRTSAAVLVAKDPAPGRYTDAERAARPTELASLAGKDALSAVVRMRREVGLDSSVGFLGTSWNFANRRNQTVGLDARFALGARSTWSAQALVTTSHLPFPDATSGTSALKAATGFGYATELSRTSARLSLQLLGDGYTPEYRAALGYLQRSDTNRWSVIARYNGRSSHGPLLSWSAINTSLAQFDWRARMQYGYVYPRLLLAFKRQTYLNLSAYRDYARVFEEEFGAARTSSTPGAFLGAPERSTWYHGFTVDTGTSPVRSVTASFVFDRSWNNLDFDGGAGQFPRVSPAALLDPRAALDPGLADSRYLGLRATWQPSALARLTVSYEASRLTRQDTGLDAYRQKIASGRLLVSLSRFLWVRGRVDYDSLDRGLFHQVVFAWTPKPGRAVYAGYDETGEWTSRSESRPRLAYARQGRTIFVKASWSRALRLRPAQSASKATSPS